MAKTVVFFLVGRDFHCNLKICKGQFQVNLTKFIDFVSVNPYNIMCLSEDLQSNKIIEVG